MQHGLPGEAREQVQCPVPLRTTRVPGHSHRTLREHHEPVAGGQVSRPGSKTVIQIS